jgi:hypothetical protein
MADNRYKATLTLDVYYEDLKGIMNKHNKSQLANDLLDIVNFAIKNGYLLSKVKNIETSEWHSMVTIPTTEFVEELPESITRWDLRENNV